MSEAKIDLFGRSQLGYAIVETEKFDEWRRFLKDGMGLHLEYEDNTLQAWRIDAQARRFILRRGPAEDFVALGVQLADEETLTVVKQRLASRRIDVDEGKPEEARLRQVDAFWTVKGPKELPIELYLQAEQSTAPLDMLTSEFLTGDGGMGHVAITSREPEKMRRFWQEIFDARFSDHVDDRVAGVHLAIDFLRLNERHHSIAIAATEGLPGGLRLDPIRTRIQHINLQAATWSDLTDAYIRLRKMGVEMALEMGQHPNDGEQSFYAMSPSGFEMELGWNPLVVDEASWQPINHVGMSSWGHRPGNPSPLHNLGNFKQGLRSALKPEYSPLE